MKVQVCQPFARTCWLVWDCPVGRRLLTVSIAVSSRPARPQAVVAPAAAQLNAPAPAAEAAQAAPAARHRQLASAACQRQTPRFSGTSESSRKALPTRRVRPARLAARREIGVYHFATTLWRSATPRRPWSTPAAGRRSRKCAWKRCRSAGAQAGHEVVAGRGQRGQPADAAEILIDGDKAYARGAGGGTWQPWRISEATSRPTRPDGYLAGIKNVRR